jgi:hypothetical protein
MSQPVRSEHPPDLSQPFSWSEPKMDIEELEGDGVIFNLYPEDPPRFTSRISGEQTGFDDPHGQATEHGIPVVFFCDGIRWVKMILHI